MKYSIAFFFAMVTILLNAQNIETFVNPFGITLKDQTDTERIILNGGTKRVAIQINDSLQLDVQGGLPTSIKLINFSSLAESGLELDFDGAFGFGEFGSATPNALLPITNIQNGLIRPQPNTTSLATNFEERLRIMPDGKIGIGTIEPMESLDIDGRLRIRDIPAGDGFEIVLVVSPEGVVHSRPFPMIPSSSSFENIKELLKLIQEQNEKIETLSKRLNKLEGN